MKKLFAFALVLCILFSITACSNGGDYNDNGDDNWNNDESDTIESNSGDENGTGGDKGNKIDPSRITDITDFREGKALVRYGEMTSDEYQTVYCIDKSGEILFTLSGINVGGGITGFYNGLTTVTVHENGKAVVWLCNEKGEITKPEDVGATNFLISADSSNDQTISLLADGYIFVEKTETDFAGSATKAAILNSDFEVVVEYSEELYGLYERLIYCSYYGGYLYDMWHYELTEVLDLNTGKLVEDFSTLVSSIERKNESDLWYLGGDYSYYDLVTGEQKVDLSEYSETIATTFEFNCGLAPILFGSADKNFFAIVKEDGSFCFEPVEIKGYSPSVKIDGGKFLVISSIGNDYYLETFDSNGKLGETAIQMDGMWFSVRLSDDIVIVSVIGSNTQRFYYTVDLQALSW